MDGMKKTILIVDDMELNRKILSLILEQDYRILEAANGLEALHMLKEEKIPVSLILLDIVMPVMGGFQFLDHIKKDRHLRDIPIIFVTAEAYRENVIEGMKQGVCDMIAKPFDPNLVITRVNRLIQLTEMRRKKEELPVEEPVAAPQVKPEIALIVDDIVLNRSILRLALEQDYPILEAANGREALELLDANRGKIAVVLLDIIMPVLGGIEMMQSARQMKLVNDLPVIAITTEDSPVKMGNMKDLGICEIIHKPFNPSVVKNRVDQLVELYANQRKAALQEV